MPTSARAAEIHAVADVLGDILTDHAHLDALLERGSTEWTQALSQAAEHLTEYANYTAYSEGEGGS